MNSKPYYSPGHFTDKVLAISTTGFSRGRLNIVSSKIHPSKGQPVHFILQSLFSLDQLLSNETDSDGRFKTNELCFNTTQTSSNTHSGISTLSSAVPTGMDLLRSWSQYLNTDEYSISQPNGVGIDQYKINTEDTCPTITISTSSSMLCSGSSPISLTATGHLPNSLLQWQKDGINIPGETSAVYSTTASGSYKLVSNTVTSFSCTSNTIQINQPPPKPSIAANISPPYCAGTGIVLTANGCPATGSALWSDGSVGISIPVVLTDATNFYMVRCTTGSCKGPSSNGKYIGPDPPNVAVKLWDRSYGGASFDSFGAMSPRASGGFLLGGNVNNTQVNTRDFVTVRIASNGNKLDEKTWSVPNSDENLQSITPSDNFGFWLSGTYTQNSNNSYFIQKIDSTATNFSVRRTIGGSLNDYLYSSSSTGNGGVLLGGSSNSPSGGDKTDNVIGKTDFWLVKIDAGGNKVWDKTFGSTDIDNCYKVITTADGGFLAVGTTYGIINGLSNRGSEDYYAVKVDANGQRQWENRYGGSSADICLTVAQTRDGGYLLGGYTTSPISGEVTKVSKGLYDWWIVKIDANGNYIRDKRYGGANYEQLTDIKATTDGYLAVGYTISDASEDISESPRGPITAGNRDYWVMKIDDNGNKLWDRRYGGSGSDFDVSIQPTIDNGFIVAGISDSPADYDKTATNLGNYDWWAVKVWVPTPPTVTITKPTICDGESTFLDGANCPGTVTWSTGATGKSLIVSPTNSTTYTAICSLNGVASCPSAPIVVNVCSQGSQSTYGYSSGGFVATDGGAATYGISIVLPAGSSGIKPELGLSYNSQGGNGLLGVGWNLDGLHAINRSSQTRAQDEAYEVSRNSANGITFTKADRYALDGARLVLNTASIQASDVLNANYGDAGTEYITEQNQFARVSIPEVLANGAPKYFVAYTKDGLMMEFGNTLDSRVDANDANATPITWLVNKIADRNGNYIKFTYQREVLGSTGTFPYGKTNTYPLRIEYTINDNSGAAFSAYNRVEFEYIPRADKQWSFVNGAYVGGGDKLLSKIRVFGNNTEVRKYSLTYTSGKFTANSLLYQVQECADTLCHEPTTFNWQNEDRITTDLTYKPTSTTAQGPFSVAVWGPADKRVRLFGDWDGDGTSDLCAVDTTNASQTTFTYYLNRFPNSIPNGQSFSLPGKLVNYQYRTADFNADGKADIILWYTKTGDAKIQLTAFSNGQLQEPVTRSAAEFVQQICPNDPNRPTFNCLAVTASDVFLNREVLIQDWNGDGLTDIISISKSGKNYVAGSDYWLQTQPPTYSGNATVGEVKLFRYSMSIPNTMTNGVATQTFNRWEVADFNSDGLADVCLLDSASSQMTIYPMRATKAADKVYDSDSTKYRLQDPTYTVQFTATPAFRYNWSQTLNRFIPYDPGQPAYNLYNRPLIIADANGDGLVDIGLKLSLTSYQFQLGTGQFGFFPDPYLLTAARQPLGDDITTELVDFNNDGSLDLLTYTKTGVPGSSVRLGGFDKPGLSFDNPLDPSLLSEQGVSFFFGHYSKSNLNELLYFKIVNQRLTTQIYSNALSKTDQIGQINEGTGQEVQITYKTLKDPSVYTRSSTTFRYPLFEFVIPISIVSSVRTKDGIGGYSYIDYQYEGAFSHSAGRGFRGFTKVTTKDRQRNTFTIKYFTIDGQKWWLAGQPHRTEMRKDDPTNGQLLSLYEATTGAIPYVRSSSYASQPSYLKSRSYYSYGRQSTSRRYDLNSNQQVSYTQSRVRQDTYGNATMVVADHGSGVKDSTINQYTDNVSGWLLGRVTRSTVYRFSPGKPTFVRTVAFEYNPTTGQLIRQLTDPDSTNRIRTESLYSHDAAGNIIQTELKAWNGAQVESRISQTVYDNQKRLKLSATNSLGHQSSATYNSATGSIITSTDINGLTNSYEYDAFQRVQKSTSPTGEETIIRIYRTSGWNSPPDARFVMYKKQGNAPPVIEHYDILNRLIRVDNTNFGGQPVIYTVTFDNRGEMAGETGPGLNKQYQYDLMSRITRTTDFGEDNRYEYIGNQVTLIDIKGRKRVVEKNAQGQVINAQFQSSNGSIATHAINYDYDGRNNPTRVVGNGNGFDIKNYYDARGNKIRTDDPALGTYRYEHNGFGEVTKQTDPKGNFVLMEYDRLGRITKRTEPEGITTYTYDTGNKAKGKVSSINGVDNIVYAYSYDNFGRLGMEAKTINGGTYATVNTYTADGKLDRITYPSGLIVKHEYNAQQYLYIVRRVSDGKVLWRAKTTNAIDNVLTEDVYEKGTGQNAVLRHSYTYATDLSHPTQSQTFLPMDTGTPRIQKNTNYDNSYLVTGMAETVYSSVGQLLRNGSTTYQYDDLDRLTRIAPSISFPQRSLTENTAVTMTYDLYGNITNKSDVGSYQYDKNALGGPRFLTGITPVTSGVCIPSFRVNTDYSSFNKVKRIANDTSYALIYYGPDHQRVMQKLYVKNQLTKTKIYVNGLYEVEIIGTQIRETSYIQGGLGVVAIESKVGNSRSVQLWVKDNMNNLVAVVDTNGIVLQHLRYDVWGRRWNADQPGPTADTASYRSDRGFTKHEHLDLFQLINMNGRIYDPVIARFLSPDPFIQSATDLQGYNRYAYVTNNPLTYTDPSGYGIFDPFKKVVRDIGRGAKDIGRGVGDVINGRESVGGFFNGLGNNPLGRLIPGAGLVGAYQDAKLVGKVLDSKYMPSVIRDNWRPVVTTAAAAVAGAVVTVYSGNAQAGAAASGFTGSFLGSTWSGGSYTDAMKAGAKGAVIGAATSFLSSGLNSAIGDGNALWQFGARVVGNAAIQGSLAEVQGGDWQDGAKMGALSVATSNLGSGISGNDFSSVALRVGVAATLGGTISVVGGGKYANGAMSSGFGELSGSWQQRQMVKQEQARSGLADFDPTKNGLTVAEETPKNLGVSDRATWSVLDMADNIHFVKTIGRAFPSIQQNIDKEKQNLRDKSKSNTTSWID